MSEFCVWQARVDPTAAARHPSTSRTADESSRKKSPESVHEDLDRGEEEQNMTLQDQKYMEFLMQQRQKEKEVLLFSLLSFSTNLKTLFRLVF